MKRTDINVLTVDADAFLRAPAIDTSLALCVKDVGPRAAEVKGKLIALYGGDTVIDVDGADAPLKDMRGGKEVYVPAQPNFDKRKYNIADAIRVMARLMQKPGGCPWDSVQTHDSIRINLIEEAYEAVDAIDKRDLENMREEFGDVLLQSLIQSAISEREGEFDFAEVCDGLCKKLIGRHSFIFGGDTAGSADDALFYWDKNKAAEKNYTSLKGQLEKLPDSFPALLLAQKVYKKSKKAGVALSPAAELDAALSSGDRVRAICALVGALADEGKDAEVELNAYVKAAIAAL